MPGGDRTGPRGEGAKTGRGAGLCSGNDSPGYTTSGSGMGGGRGRGHRHIFHATNASDDLGSLKQEADLLEKRLKSIIDRIKDIESDSGKDNG
jgi:hypothetical protein